MWPRSQNEPAAELELEALMPGDSVSMNEHKNQCKRTGGLSDRGGW